MKKVLNYLQNIGKSLMMPIAVLPAAALLMGIGYWIDPEWGTNSVFAAFLIQSGSALIDNMGILFAIGVSYGMSKDNNGAAALSGLVTWLIVQNLLAPDTVALIQQIDATQVSTAFGKIDNQFIGILVGVLAGTVYNLTYQVELPQFLSFFSGRRLSAIVSSIAALILSFLLMYIWPFIFQGLVNFGELILQMKAVGAGIYGFLNRALIPLGLHHALNSVFWFDVAGINDIPNYLSGQTPEVALEGYTVGMYQAGFFPIMMFGLPAAAFAMYQEARPAQKAKVGGILFAGAVASFFTGVTEPLEFSFMFVAWPLYILHAILTGISLYIAASMQWIAGFGFSAGLVDYALSFQNPNAQNILMLLVQGIIFAALYYLTFKFAIRKFNILTPGRDPLDDDNTKENNANNQSSNYDELAQNLLDLIGQDNLEVINNCATRLRLDVKDSSIIDEHAIKRLDVAGVIKPNNQSIQIIIGPKVEFVADAMKKLKK